MCLAIRHQHGSWSVFLSASPTPDKSNVSIRARRRQESFCSPEAVDLGVDNLEKESVMYEGAVSFRQTGAAVA